jgi:hypothetical protein
MYRFVALALVAFALTGSALAAEETATVPARFEKAPDATCALLDDPEIRARMDGVLFHLLRACGREHELGLVSGTAGIVVPGMDIAAGTDVPVSDPTGDVGTSSHTQSETSLALNEVTGTICSGFNDSWHEFANSNGFTGFARSVDGGTTFTDQGALGAGSGGDPSIVWRRADGHFYFAALKSGDLGIWKSSDDCQTFQEVGLIHDGNSDDKELIAVDNDPSSPFYGRLYCVWTHFDAGGNIHGVYSDDGGQTWTSPQLISPSSNVQGAWPVVAPGGTVYVAWVTFGSSVITIRVAESTDGGASWTVKINPATDRTQPQNAAATSNCFRSALNGNIRYLPSPQIAVGPDGVLHVVYSYKPSSDDDVDVFYRRSSDGGDTWDPEVRVNDDATTTDQFFPTLSVGASNQVSIAWYDRRNDPDDNLLVDYYQRMSFDGGATWTTPSERLSDESSPIYLDTSLASCYHGDYDTQIQTSSHVVAQWADDRRMQNGHNDADVWVDRVPVSTDFLVLPTPSSRAVCAPADATIAVDVPQFEGFDEEVALTTGTLPTNMTDTFVPDTVTPPGVSTLTLSTAGVAPGLHTVDVIGASTPSAIVHEGRVQVELFGSTAPSPTPTSPANGATGVANVPTLTWIADPTAVTTTVDVAEDPGFTSIIESLEVAGDSATLSTSLTPVTEYWWRLKSTNPCGESAYSAVFSFTVRAIPAILLVDDDDSDDVRSYYTDIIDAMGRDYDIWDTANSDTEPSAAESAPYQVIIWFTGDEFGGYAGPGSASEAELETWMAGGGCLLISSQDYVYDRGVTPFMTNRLGLGDADSDTSQTTVTGAGPVFSGIGPAALTYPGSNFSDTFTPTAQGVAAFTGDQGTGAVQLESEGLGVFLGFPLEAMAASERQQVLEAFLEVCIPSTIFSDGFEDGSINWSSTTP